MKTKILVLDTETTNLYAELAEIVEIAAATWVDNNWSVTGQLLGAKNGIPPEASAKNNISHRMIQGLPTFEQSQDQVLTMLHWPNAKYYVAHNAKYDRAVLSHNWQQMGNNEAVAVCNDNTRWLCTWRLSQHLLKHDFAYIEYGLNYLRYKLDLPVPDGIQLHRAQDDTYLCAVLLDFLAEYALIKGVITPESEDELYLLLNQLCWKPLPITVWPFGKYKGKNLTEIPNDYYTWALANIPALKEDNPEFDWDLTENLKQVLIERLEANQ